MSVGDTAADRRPALRPFNPFFEAAFAGTGWVHGRKRGPLQAKPLHKGSGRFRHSQPPSNQSSLSTRRVTLDPVDSLSGQAGLLGNLSDAYDGLAQTTPHRVSRRSPKVPPGAGSAPRQRAHRG